MVENFTLDATVIVAMLGLFGTIYNTKMGSITKTNQQLIEMVEEQHEEIRQLKHQHREESEKLESKISQLTNENIELRNQIFELKIVLKKNKVEELA